MALSLQSGMSIDVERFTQGQYVGMETLHVKVKILLVDDDSTILAIASTLLRTFKYEVTAVKNSADALSTLRVRRGAFDLVVTDYHMPGMNGLELQKVVQAEYKLPVIVMSADERECIIMKTLECGAAFFIVKPIKAEDVKNIWQYAVAARKGKSVMSMDKGGAINGYYESTAGEVQETEIAMLGEAMEMEGTGEAVEPEEVDSMASMDEIKERRTKRASTKRKHKKMEKDSNGVESRESNNPKRSKVVWTTTLHNLFLQALNQIGLDKAVPKKILEYMGVPGLTRENVASHLQKYRIFLRRVADKTYTRSTSLEKSTNSSFAETLQLPINDFLEDGLDYSKLSQSTLPADFCKNSSSSSPGSLTGSSSSGLCAIQLSSQSSDVTESGISFITNSSGLQMINHRLDITVPSAARLPFGNAVAMTMNSLACTDRTYLQKFQSDECPPVPLGGLGTIGNTNQGVEKQNTEPAMSVESFLMKFSTRETVEDSIDPINDDNFMNSSGRFMDFLTQGDPSVGLNDSEHPTQVFPFLLKKDSAAIAPGAVSCLDEAKKEDPPTPVEKTAAVPNTPLQHHAGDHEFFNLLFEQMHCNHHPLSDSSGDSVGVFSSCSESPFVGAPNQKQANKAQHSIRRAYIPGGDTKSRSSYAHVANVQEHGNENRRVANPTEPFRLQSQATQDQQLAGQDIPTLSMPKRQDVWTDHPSAEDQIWDKDFVDSLLDSSSPYLL